MRADMTIRLRWWVRSGGVAAAAALIGWSAAGARSATAEQAPAKSRAKPPAPARPRHTPVPPDERETVERAWKIFADAEAEKNLEKRGAALLALGNAGDRDDVMQILRRALADPQPELRRSAAAAAGLARARTMIPQLQKALDDPSPSVRVAAARSLWQMKDYTGSALFERILKHQAPMDERGLRAEWHQAMGKASDPEYLFVLGLHEGAGTLLGPYAFVFPVYRYFSTDRSAPGRAAIAALLGERHTDGAVAALELALVDKSALVRAAAAISLGKSERPEEIKQLAPLLHDRKQVVRLSAAAAVVRLSPPGSGDTGKQTP